MTNALRKIYSGFLFSCFNHFVMVLRGLEAIKTPFLREEICRCVMEESDWKVKQFLFFRLHLRFLSYGSHQARNSKAATIILLFPLLSLACSVHVLSKPKTQTWHSILFTHRCFGLPTDLFPDKWLSRPHNKTIQYLLIKNYKRALKLLLIIRNR